MDKTPALADIHPEMLDAREAAFNAFPQQNAALPIRNGRRVHFDFQQEALRIDQDMALASFDLLPAIVASVAPSERAPFSLVLTVWLSIIAALGWGSRPSSIRRRSRKVVLIVSHRPLRRHCRS
jgi:hypothetical protein